MEDNGQASRGIIVRILEWVTEVLGLSPSLPPSICVSLAKLLDLSISQFPHK